jgi:N-carbamoylputrescine amidase
MRVTVCELPHEPAALEAAWAALCAHTSREASELVLLPELAMVEPLWAQERFDLARWRDAEELSDHWLARLTELRTTFVVGTRPVTIDGRLLNQGYLAFTDGNVAPLRSKCHLPEEAGSWEARWFDRGHPVFPPYRAGALSFGLNICTELWALESYAEYARRGVQAILAPRATAATTTAKWLAAGVVAAVRSGAFSLSSNRVAPTGACGGIGWIISPDGQILATTSCDAPFVTIDIDLDASTKARTTYPRYVFP